MQSAHIADTAHPEGPSWWERPVIAGGILFALLQLAALAVFVTTLAPKMPAVDAPAAEVAALYAEHGDLLLLNNFLLSLPVPFFLLFLGGLYTVLRRAEGGSGALAVAALGAGIATAMTWPLGILLSGIGTTIATEGGDAATIKALDGMAPLSLALSAFPRALLLAATSAVLLRSRTAPRWIGWLGLSLAAVSAVGTSTLVMGSMFPVLALGSLLFELWVLGLAVALLRRPSAVGRLVPAAARA